MQPIVYYHPRCSTCARALRWLDGQAIDVCRRDLLNEPPTEDELSEWVARSTQPLARFFNTSGRLYRELNLKARLVSATAEETLRILASDPMLLRRPLLVADGGVYPGFREAEWLQILK